MQVEDLFLLILEDEDKDKDKDEAWALLMCPPRLEALAALLAVMSPLHLHLDFEVEN